MPDAAVRALHVLTSLISTSTLLMSSFHKRGNQGTERFLLGISWEGPYVCALLCNGVVCLGIREPILYT